MAGYSGEGCDGNEIQFSMHKAGRRAVFSSLPAFTADRLCLAQPVSELARSAIYWPTYPRSQCERTFPRGPISSQHREGSSVCSGGCVWFPLLKAIALPLRLSNFLVLPEALCLKLARSRWSSGILILKTKEERLFRQDAVRAFTSYTFSLNSNEYVFLLRSIWLF